MGGVTESLLRWNQLRKQGLDGEHRGSFYDVAREALGLHSTDYWTPYLSVWARIGNYDATKVFNKVNSGNLLYRRPAFRNTHHMIHIDNMPLILAALGPHLTRNMRPAPPIKELSDTELEDRISEIVSVLEQGPMNMTDLKKELPHIGNQMRWLLLMANGRGLVIRSRGSHARSNRLDYDLFSRWVKGFKPLEISEEEARTQLALQYIQYFGPVTLDDLCWWMPCKITEGKKIVKNLGTEITTYDVQGTPHFITIKDLEFASSIEEPTEPIVNFLPYEDHFPKAFTHRAWYLTDDARDVLYPRLREHYWPPEMMPPPPGPPKGMNASGEMRPSIWMDGQVVGRWEIDTSNGSVVVSYGLFSKVTSKVKKIVESKRDDLKEFIENQLLPISGG
ncbi:MAG: DNA glycosylase AlkZ-like family protein [Candidatus Thorarchaeota archaeon]